MVWYGMFMVLEVTRQVEYGNCWIYRWIYGCRSSELFVMTSSVSVCLHEKMLINIVVGWLFGKRGHEKNAMTMCIMACYYYCYEHEVPVTPSTLCMRLLFSSM